MKRRSDESLDPLDLLLDTVCNLFAVMIFIAIFAAILVEPPSPDTPAPLGPNITAMTDTEDPAAERVISVPDPELVEADLNLRLAEEELSRRIETIERLETSIHALASGTRSDEDLARDSNARIESLQAEIEATRSITEVPMRTPREAARADAIPTSIFLIDGRVFLPNDFRGWKDEAVPSNEWLKYMGKSRLAPDFLLPNRSDVARRDDGSVIRRLFFRLDAGIRADTVGALRANPTWRSQIGGLIPGKHLIYINVLPDSFEEFGVVRSELARLGFDYNVSITLQDPPLLEETWVIGIPTGQ
ncbi:hypothetical protein OAR33_00225 [bacterium]|nr:hypothetical protein [bacterium]MDC0991979.1 hypothetical protein [bacterium]